MENEEIEILEEFDENEKIKKADINNENKPFYEMICKRKMREKGFGNITEKTLH